MDLFAAFPQLSRVDDPALKERSLRLLSVSALAYDENACYFEISDPRYWVESPEGETTLGMGGARVRADVPGPLLEALFRHIREGWNSEPQYFPGSQTYLVEGQEHTVFSAGSLTEADTPQLLILTPPRLGGGELPDALVQAVYFLRLGRKPHPVKVPGLVQVRREAMDDFLAEGTWRVVRLLAQPWADILSARPLPPRAHLRPVLALRGLRRVWGEDDFPSFDTNVIISADSSREDNDIDG
ncbi:MAG: hypothetical protein ACP5GX_02715 [Anaerolineae bacterium]